MASIVGVEPVSNCVCVHLIVYRLNTCGGLEMSASCFLVFGNDHMNKLGRQCVRLDDGLQVA